ncbi:hypothetical protein AN220_30020, partial [Streptomyces nanshensis]
PAAEAPRTRLSGRRLVSWMFWARVEAHELLARAGSGEPALMRRLLHLDPAEPLDDARQEAARRLLTRALAEGRDASDPAVAAAFHLEESGVLGDSTRLSTRYLDGATGQGRDFTGDADRSVVDLTETADADGRKAAPWAGDKDRHGNDKPAPYLVRAELDPADADFLLLTVDGATWRATHAEFLELLAADPALQAEELSTGVVLDIPELDRRAPGLADAAAQRLGRHVHSTAQDSGVSAIGRDGTAVLELLPAADTPDAPLTWNRSTPRWSDQTAPAPRSVPDPLPEHAPLPAEGTAAGPRPVPGIGRPVPGA